MQVDHVDEPEGFGRRDVFGGISKGSPEGKELAQVLLRERRYPEEFNKARNGGMGA